MKRFLLFFYIFLGLTGLLQAQDDTDQESDTLFYKISPPSEGKLKIGVGLGAQVSILSGSESERATPFVGITGGTYLRYNFSKRLTLQPAINIGFKGSRFNRSEPDYYNSLKLLYLETPLQIFYTYQQAQKNQIGTGFYMARLINASLSSNGGSLTANQSALPIKEYDWGIVTSWLIKFNYFYLQTSYSIGLSNINNAQSWPSGDNASVIKPTNKGGTFYNQTLTFQLIF